MKFIIRWNIGYGDSVDIIEADNQELADREAYDLWRDEVEGDADYEALEYTEELAEEHGLD